MLSSNLGGFLKRSLFSEFLEILVLIKQEVHVLHGPSENCVSVACLKAG